MDLTNIFFISIVIIVTIVAVVLYQLPILKAWFGTRQVRKATEFLLQSENYYLMKDVVLLTFEGLQKFDYLIVSRFGVFIVMAQHYSGVIVGSEFDSYWSQYIRNKKVLQFSNPSEVIKERSHTIRGLLGLSRRDVFPIVLFTGIAGFKTKMSNKITYGGEYLKYIRSKTDVLLSTTEIEKFISTIEVKRKRQGLTNESDHIEKYQQKVSALELGDICPSCGSKMEVRRVENGLASSKQMLVCHLYPTCRESRSL